MPEGPELFKNSQFVNTVCKGRIFCGKIVKSAVNVKNPEVKFQGREYTISAESRGKEMALILLSHEQQGETKIKSEQGRVCEAKRLRILFRFGMSGKFTFGTVADVHKHAHLNFFTKDKPPMVLSFVDVRRFGRWEVTDSWSKDRGPDPLFEYSEFRSNILGNLDDRIFDKPLCEVMHNQKYFNGIGNYLRAEIIFRAEIPPFTCARSVLTKLTVKQEDMSQKSDKLANGIMEHPDILELCNKVPNEVIDLPGKGYEPSGKSPDYTAFCKWLRCYYNSEMRNIVDHDGRTMWFKGEAGDLVPKEAKSRGMQNSRKRKQNKMGNKKDAGSFDIQKESSPPKKCKSKSQQKKKSAEGDKKRRVGKKTTQPKTTVVKVPKTPVRRSLRLHQNTSKESCSN